MFRREFIYGLAALATAAARPAHGFSGATPLKLGDPQPFDPVDVVTEARRRAAAPFSPAPRIPEPWTEIEYDEYRAIWFDHHKALWNETPEVPLRLDLLPPGLYYPTPVEIDIVADGAARPLVFDIDIFHTTDKFPDLPVDDSLGFSGMRLRGEIEQPDVHTEFAVFQGASYFRGIGAGQIYGLSARGLAIDVAGPEGEEFPEFRRFWLEQPAPGAQEVILHALLDSPSCTGAYRFRMRPGVALRIEVEAQVFARRELGHLGLGALTSMFQFDETNRDRFSDFRSAIHDSDGLLIANGQGETLWRPLANPRHLQVSTFQDQDPKGFGLMQRNRDFEDYGDLEALYHRRPSLWIEPRGSWGPGWVTLVEIPTDDEVYDNIVAYWRPAEPVPAGGSLAFSYGMTWSGRGDWGDGMPVINTRAGEARDGGLRFAIDFAYGPDLPGDLRQVEIFLRSSAGELSPAILQRNPATDGARLAFTLHPGDAETVEMRAQLRFNDAPLSEVWLYRWTA